MALVDPRLLETLRTPIQPTTDTNLRDLDSEMTHTRQERHRREREGAVVQSGADTLQ